MFRTARMNYHEAKDESEHLKSYAKQLERDIEKFQKASSIAGPVFETLHKLADEYLHPQAVVVGSSEKYYIRAMALSAEVCIAFSQEAGLSRMNLMDLFAGNYEEVPSGDLEAKRSLIPYLEAMAHFQYLFLERLAFHEEKEDSPFFDLVGGLWWETFDEPLLPISSANIGLMRHGLKCSCPINDEFVPFLEVCPILLRHKIMTKAAAKKVALVLLKKAVKEEEDWKDVTYYRKGI